MAIGVIPADAGTSSRGERDVALVISADAGISFRHRSLAGHRSEAGVGSVLALLTVLVLVTLAAVGGLAMSYAAASRAVRQAADLVAVSGAQAHAKGADACAEAHRIANRNDVDVGQCEVSGDQIDFVVEVRVSRQVGWRMPGLPASVAATAYAGNVAGVP